MEPYSIPGIKAREVVERDHQVISASYPRAYPFVMDRGRGSIVWDVDDNRFVDFAAGIAVVSTGHSHPRIIQAIKDQIEKFIHISPDFYNLKMVELGEKLEEIAPFEERGVSFITNSGTESVEAAIKLARYYTKRSQFIGFLGGFHGRTIGSVSFTASKPKYHHGFYPLMPGVIHAPYPDPYRPILSQLPGEDYGETVVRYIEEQILGRLAPANDIAGILLEPIQGEGGYIVPPAGFFPALRELCDRHGILLIADEVQSGIGRTGKMWAINHYGVEPDIICIAKGIASGMPIGAMVARASIATWTKGAHGNTYGGNPVACSAALTTIDLIEEGYMENAAIIGEYTLNALRELQIRHPYIGDVRGKGLMIGIEFVKDRATKEPASELRDEIVDQAFKRGLLLLGCGVSTIRIAPPLCINRDEIDEGLEILEESIYASIKEDLVFAT